MAEAGLLHEVRWEYDGTEVTALAALGATTISVLDPYALSDTERVWIGESGPYDVVEVDEDTNLVTIDPALTEEMDEGDPVVPDVGGQQARVWVAEVVLADADTAIEVPLTVHDLAVMPEGYYDPPVAILLADDLESVVDLPGQVPVIPGDYIPPDTLPEPELPDPSDGQAPPSSPTPEVTEGIGAFFLRWTPPPNADPMRFEVHVSDEPGFAPFAETFYSETAGYSMTVRHLPEVDPETGEPLPFLYSYTDEDTGEEIEHPYYFRIIAKDVDGAAPPSFEATGLLHQITGSDIRVHSIVAENIAYGTLTGDLFSGQLVLGSTISTGALDDSTDPPSIVGARIDLGPDGLIIYDADNEIVAAFPLSQSGEAVVRAHMEMLSAEVLDNFTMHGTNNQIATEADLVLAAGVTPPNAPPTVTEYRDWVQLDTTTATGPYQPNPGYNLGVFSLNPARITSMDWNPSWGGFWAVIQSRSNGLRIWRFNADGSLKNNPFESRPWVDDYNGTDSPTHCTDHNPNVTTSGDSFMYRNASGDWYIWGSAPNGTNVINKIPSSWVLDSNKPPDLSYDQASDRYMLSQSNNTGSNDRLHVRRFHCVTGPNFPNAVSDGVFQAAQGTGLSRRNNGLVYGTQVVGGGNRYAWSTDSWATVYVVDTSGVRKNTNGAYEEWTKPGAALGFCHDGSRFASVDATGRITFYTDWTWPQSDSTAYVGVSAYDSDTAGDPSDPHTGQSPGQHETPVGGVTKFNLTRRAKLRIQVPETRDSGAADDPDKWGLYYARQAALPVAAQYRHVGYVGSPSGPTTLELTGDPTSGHAPPGGVQGQPGAVNNFPGASPGEIVSAANRLDGTPKIALRGNGSGNHDGLIPPGCVQMWAGAWNKIPNGWLYCDGSPLSTSLYPDLHAAIGYAYGGSGTTFNLPDFRDRFPKGSYAGDHGGSGGQSSITLSTSQLPEHTHPMDHGHAGLKNNTAGASNTTWQAGANNANNVNTGAGNPVQDYTGNTGSRGNNAPIDIMNPWAAIHFIIKI